ncbi:MAG: metal-dependent hydrolase [DPANN group archaeon]|nr:metal-dependent hydrolase [DPANN group archaeon]
MYPQSHFLFSFLVVSVFVKLGVFDFRVALFVAIFAFLVDVDHFILFVSKFKDSSLRNAWNKAVYGKYAGRTFVHHWIGFLILTVIIIGLYFYNLNWFWIVGLGYYTHMILDYAHLNFLKIKGRLSLRFGGFVERIGKFEALFDIFVLVGIALVWI